MKIEEFIKEYNASVNKEECVKKHIIDKYVPYEEKIALCKNAVKSANYRDGKISINSPLQYMFFIISLFSKYTDIEMYDGSKAFIIFNALDSLGLVDMFYSLFPEKEITKMNTILQMVSNDFMENERSLITYLDTKISALNIGLESLEKVIGESNEGKYSEIKNK